MLLFLSCSGAGRTVKEASDNSSLAVPEALQETHSVGATDQVQTAVDTAAVDTDTVDTDTDVVQKTFIPSTDTTTENPPPATASVSAQNVTSTDNDGQTVASPPAIEEEPADSAQVERPGWWVSPPWLTPKSILASGVSLMGNASIGPSSIEAHPKRDMVVMYYLDTFEGEPYGPGYLYVLDGKNKRGWVLRAWDYAWSEKGNQIFYAAEVQICGEDEIPSECYPKAAARMKVSESRLKELAYQSGHSGAVSVTQMFVLNLDSQTTSSCRQFGGGMLMNQGEQIIGIDKPYYYAFPFWEEYEPPTPRIWNKKRRRWSDMQTGAEKVYEAIEENRGEKYFNFTAEHEQKGGVLAMTRNRKVGLVVEDDRYTVSIALF